MTVLLEVIFRDWLETVQHHNISITRYPDIRASKMSPNLTPQEPTKTTLPTVYLWMVKLYQIKHLVLLVWPSNTFSVGTNIFTPFSAAEESLKSFLLKKYIYRVGPGRWIGTGSDGVEWPVTSPDLTPSDFFFGLI